jgi:hypothetical protein
MGAAPPRLKFCPTRMPDEVHLVEVVHAGTPECPVGGRKTRRPDDVRLDSKTGGEAENRPGVLGNVGLEKRDAHVCLRGVMVLRAGPGGLWRKRMERNVLCDFSSFRHTVAFPLALPWQGCQ